MDNELFFQQEMISQIREIMINARQNVAVQVNNEQLLAYWNIGRVIVEHEQASDKRAEYGKSTLNRFQSSSRKSLGEAFPFRICNL